MSEKKGSKVGILIIVSIILLCSMGVLGYYVQQLKQDNKYLKSQAETLQARVDIMSNAIESIQGTISNVITDEKTENVVNNTTTTNTVIENTTVDNTAVSNSVENATVNTTVDNTVSNAVGNVTQVVNNTVSE